MRVFPIIKKVVAAAINFRVDVKSGVRTGTALSVMAAQARAATLTALSPFSGVVENRPALRASEAHSGTTQESVKTASRTSPVATGSNDTTLHKPAGDVLRVTYDLVHRSGANAVAQTAVNGRSDWTNPANAQGDWNNVLAAFAGNALGARSGRLDLDYADFPDKADLTITAARLFFYGRVFGTLGNNATVILQWTRGGATLPLQTITGNLDFLAGAGGSNGLEFDILGTPLGGPLAAGIESWDHLNSLRTFITADAALGEIWGAEIDAVALRVVATRTDLL